jgi:hypothetical protein
VFRTPGSGSLASILRLFCIRPTPSSSENRSMSRSRAIIRTGYGLGAQTGSRVRIDGRVTAAIPVEDNLVDVASALDRDEPVCNVA